VIVRSGNAPPDALLVLNSEHRRADMFIGRAKLRWLAGGIRMLVVIQRVLKGGR
jgi:hypothetical protein